MIIAVVEISTSASWPLGHNEGYNFGGGCVCDGIRSNRGITLIVSSCGETIRHEIDYRSKFDDGHGNVQSKFLARPAIAHMLFEFLPLIDEHNKARKSHLALERRWQTTSCWF